jgi:hypothetical protein
MLVDTTEVMDCLTPDGCGLALACISGKCRACTKDSDCAAGEACALDHCLRAGNVECRSRWDCGDGESLCVLSGYEATPRANETMKAHCMSPSGGLPQDELVGMPGSVYDARSPFELGIGHVLSERVENHAR